MKNKLVILCSLLLFFLSGCKSPAIYKPLKYAAWQEYEARLHDVPIMLNAKPEEFNGPDDTNQFSCSYMINNKLDDVEHFYQGQMERLGWQLYSSFNMNERILVFEKPSKVCVLSLRPIGKQVKVVIFCRIK
jgi:hypothetical protein